MLRLKRQRSMCRQLHNDESNPQQPRIVSEAFTVLDLARVQIQISTAIKLASASKLIKNAYSIYEQVG